MALDSLHILDEGIIRLFADSCFIHFSQNNLTSLPTSQCIGIANEMILKIPRGVHLAKKTLFIGKSMELQANMSGLIRRQTCPLLWVAVMGFNDLVAPDRDPLLQAALELDYLYNQLLGVNLEVAQMHRTEQWITYLQKRFFQLSVEFVSLFHVTVKTKLHRCMRHIGCHLTCFGMVRWGSNDRNETVHKLVKVVYQKTNRRRKGFAVQLLKSGYANFNDGLEEDLVPHTDFPSYNTTNSSQLTKAIRTTETLLQVIGSLEVRLHSIMNLRYTSSSCHVWRPLTYVTLPSRLP